MKKQSVLFGKSMKFGMLFLAVFFVIGITPSVFSDNLFELINTLSGGGTTEKYRVAFVEGDKDSDDEILLISIKGLIRETDEDDSTMPFELRKDMMEKFKKDLEVALEREQVKGILLEIDSPGGEITASDIIHHQLQKLKKAKKPILALFGMLGASGAYYVACAADQIWAHPTSVLGSIGVIIRSGNVEKLTQIIGYRDVTLKSDRTPKKDIMSPFREMTPEERKMMLSLVDSMYDRFVEIVASARKKTPADLATLADGSLFSAKQAQEKGLIDGIGYREDAFEKVVQMSGLKTAKLVKRKTKKGLAELLGQFSEAHSGVPALLSSFNQILESNQIPKFLYQLGSN